jgi:membrane peptidoglycan carboxypeptidase
MARHRDDRPGAVGVLWRIVAMGLVSALVGVLSAAFAVPFAGVLRLGAEAVSDGVAHLPARLTTEPLAERTRVLDRHGKLIATFYDENRVNVDLEDVSLIMRKAIIAIEDVRFYQHGAVDPKGTVRAFVTNQSQNQVVQGGSSITQQMVKMTLLSQARTRKQRQAATAQTYERKFRELRYAIAFEKEFSKDWILQRYLNLAYFGDGAYGIEAAAQHYFSRPASNDRDRAAARRAVVLNRMAAVGAITQERAEKVKERSLGLRVKRTSNGCVSSAAPFFCDYVRQYLLLNPALGPSIEARRKALATGGLTIRTTLDQRMQRAADASVRRHVFPTDRAIGGLAMVVPRDGAVRALAQSRPMGRRAGRGETYLNYVVPDRFGDANGFQAGSTFKVFVLAAAIRQGIPLTTRISAPQSLAIPVRNYRGCTGYIRSTETWRVQNSTGSGSFNLYTGTQQSVNTFFAQLELRTGLCEPYRLARQMGINLTDPTSQRVPSFTLGVVDTNPLEMAEAYATFAGRGIHCTARPVTEISNRAGEVLKRFPPRCNRVLPAYVADTVNDVLRGVQEPGGFGYFADLALEQESAGKTGTINRNMAVWFIGYTPNMATASMIAGANRLGHWVTLNGQTVGGDYITQAFGSTNAGPMWGDTMKRIQHLLPDARFVRPPAFVRNGGRPGATSFAEPTSQ